MKIDKKIIVNALIALVVYAAVMGLVKGGVLSRQMMSLITPVCVYVMMSVSLSLVVGFLGELSLGHAAFMSIGAYTGCLFLIATKDILPVLVSLLLAVFIGGVAAALLGVVIGIPVLRLKGDYLAIVTLGFGEIIKSVFNSLKITGGAKGLSKIPLVATDKNFTFVFILMLLVILLVSHLVNSRHGRAVCAIRDNYIAAEAVGIPVSRYKILAFVIAAFMAGMAGVIYGANLGILKPANFDYNASIEILVMVVLGGMGSIKGSIIAAVILTLLPELLRGASDYRMLIYAIALIAMMLFNNSSFKRNLTEKRFLEEYRRRSMLTGQEVEILRGGTVVPAKALGIDDDFGLIVEYPDGRQEHLGSGDVSVRKTQTK